MVMFARCLLLFRIVVLVVAPWYNGCIGLVHDCCTVVVFVAHVVMLVGLANVEMVLSNLSWPQRGYGNNAVTVASRTTVLVAVVACVVRWWW